MSQIYFIGDTNSKGTYYFFSPQQRFWVVAELDLGKSYIAESLVIVESEEYIPKEIGRQGNKHLLLAEDVVFIPRELDLDEYKIVSQCFQDGTIGKPRKELQEIGEVIKSLQKKTRKLL